MSEPQDDNGLMSPGSWNRPCANDTGKLARLLRIEAAARVLLATSQAMDDAYHDSQDQKIPNSVAYAYTDAKEKLRAALEGK